MTKLLPEWIAPRRTVLLLIDMQVDFGSPEGVLGKAGMDMRAPAAALVQSQRLAQAARAAGVAPVFVGLQTRKDLDSPTWKEWMRRRGHDADTDSGVCREGTHGAEFVGPLPQPGEAVIFKPRYSAFFGTSLDAALRARGVDTLVVCGLTTECCVDCTVRDAFQLDYHVFIATDACAAYDAEIHRASLEALTLNHAILATTDDILGAWTAQL
jgi:ureidoacrylate peracid hydrolase